MTSRPHSVSIVGIVLNGEEALIIQRRDNGAWEPPGGVLELDEAPVQGVAREVLEETGAIVNVGPLTGVYKNIKSGVVTLAFQCTMTDAPLSPTIEAASVEWIDRATILERVNETQACPIIDAMHWTGDTPVRTHDGEQLLDPIEDDEFDEHETEGSEREGALKIIETITAALRGENPSNLVVGIRQGHTDDEMTDALIQLLDVHTSSLEDQDQFRDLTQPVRRIIARYRAGTPAANLIPDLEALVYET